MKLHGRRLSIEMRGRDVARLQIELRQLGAVLPQVETAYFGTSTQRIVKEFQRTYGLRTTGIVDEATADRIEAEVRRLRSGTQGNANPTRISSPSTHPDRPCAGQPDESPDDRASPPPHKSEPPLQFVVHGTVRLSCGCPFRGQIRAFDKDMRSEESLGEMDTDPAGFYEIKYTSEKFRRAEKGSADLIVRAYDSEGIEVVASPILFNAPAVATIDLVTEGSHHRSKSEYERYVAELTPVMQRTPFAELTREDIAFLNGETAIDADHIVYLVLANRRAERTDVEAEIFYGLFRQGLPTELTELSIVPPELQRQALEVAILSNTISTWFRERLEEILSKLLGLVLRQAFDVPSEEGRLPIGELLATSLLPVEVLREFLSHYQSSKGSQEGFWEELRRLPRFQSPDVLEELQLTFQLDRLTQTNIRLLRELRAQRQRGVFRSLRELTRFDAAWWRDLLSQSARGGVLPVPQTVEGATDEERSQRYADGMVRALKAAFPVECLGRELSQTPEIDLSLVRAVRKEHPHLEIGDPLPDDVSLESIPAPDRDRARSSWRALGLELRAFPSIRNQLSDDSPISTFRNPVRAHVARVLQEATDFDLARTPIGDYFEQRPEKLAHLDDVDRKAVVAQLASTQRIFRVAPKAEHVTTLMSAGYHSAYDIARQPRELFVENFAADLGGPGVAGIVHSQATMRAAAVSVAAVTARGAGEFRPTVLRDDEPDLPLIKPIPGWANLFGGLELCDCQHCQSVYSPAAYFVDLLHWLDTPPPENAASKKGTPLTALLQRRPDLELIALSCANTNTPIPYIDLVNEVLESYVVHRFVNKEKAPVPIDARDTGTATADELRAVPQFVLNDAYEELKNAVYPMTLPFDRPLEIGRSYLIQLGTSRIELMMVFQKDGTPDESKIAAESLGFSPVEFDAVIGNGHQTYAFYGFANQALWVKKLSDVREFLKRTGVAYTDLVELLKTWFINRDQLVEESRVSLAQPTDCDLDKAEIENLSVVVLDRMHRFIRLWRKLNCPIADIDRILFAIDAEELDGPSLRRLADAKRVATELDRPLVQVLALWADIDTWGEDALYLRMFQNRAVANLKDLDPFQFDWNGAAPAPGLKHLQSPPLKNASDLLDQHVPAIVAALRITAEEMDLIRVHAGLVTDETLHVPTLSVPNLSILDRYVVLARSLQLSVRDLISMIDLTGSDPFTKHDPGSTLAFITKARKVQRSEFTLAQLEYIYRDRQDPARSPAPSAKNIVLTLEKIRKALLQIEEGLALVDDPTGDRLREQLGNVMEPNAVDTVMALVLGDEKGFPADPAEFLEENCKQFLVATEAAESLQPKVTIDAASQRLVNIAYVAERLRPFLREEMSRSAVVGVLADNLNLEEAVTLQLIDSTDGSPALIESLLFDQGGAVLDFRALVGDGLVAEYFSLPEFGGEVDANKKKDVVLDLQWDDVSPAPACARWTGQLLPPSSGAYTFYVRSSGGVRLAIGGTILIDEWDTTPTADHTSVEYSSDPVALTADTLTSIKVEYAGGQPGILVLQWSATTLTKQTVPTTQLYSISEAAMSPGGTSNVGRAVDTYRLLHKAALLVGGFQFERDELKYLSENASLFDDFNLNELPLTLVEGFATKGFDQWERLYDIVDLRHRLPGRPLIQLLQLATALEAPLKGDSPAEQRETLQKILRNIIGRDTTIVQEIPETADFEPEGAKLWALRRTLADALSCDLSVVSEVTDTGGLNLTVADYRTEEKLIAARACIELSRRIGISAIALFECTATEVDSSNVTDFVHAVRARYQNEKEWLDVAKILNDSLRESQRSALVSYLVARMGAENITTPNSLFEYFLVDTEMSACMATSRIKQAISSTQLFVQRCLLNLEYDNGPKSIDGKQWRSWRKNYRVWEANRKVFLYPENWIEPELRDNKSPFFRELETELVQTDLTDETAEQAFLHYLEKLDDVARLDVRGMYWQVEPDPGGYNPIDTLHVFGRTFNEPHQYFYRRFENHKEWTPWERVSLDIEGDHLIPVVFNRRLHLFWPIFKEVPDDDQEMVNPTEESPTHRSWRKQRDKWKKWKASVKAYEDYLDEWHILVGQFQIPDAKPKVEGSWGMFGAEIPRSVESARKYIEVLTKIIEEGDPDSVAVAQAALDEEYKTHPRPGPEPEKQGAEPPEHDLPGCATTHWEIKLASSECKHGKWTPKKLSKEALIVQWDTLPKPKRENFTFVAATSTSDELDVSVDVKGSGWFGLSSREGAFHLDGTGNKVRVRVSSDYSVYLPPDGAELSYAGYEGKSPLRFTAIPAGATDVLRKAPSSYRITFPLVEEDAHEWHGAKPYPFFFEDRRRTYFARHETSLSMVSMSEIPIFVMPDITQMFDTTVRELVPPNQEFFDLHPDDSRPNERNARELAMRSQVSLGYSVTQHLRSERFYQTRSSKSWDLQPRQQPAVEMTLVFPKDELRFSIFQHPYVVELVRALNRDGIAGVLTLSQQKGHDFEREVEKLDFTKRYDPNWDVVDQDLPPKRIVDFEPEGAYSLYNWELFFHIPLLIATQLSSNHRFEESQRWFHYIFDPTTERTGERRFWNVMPFKKNSEYARAQELLELLAYAGDDASLLKKQRWVQDQVKDWVAHPFSPHRIARMRLVAYQKTVVMKYIDNLIAWGDQLFRRDTIESMNEATQLYILAANLLGPRPQRVPPIDPASPKTFADLRKLMGQPGEQFDFSNPIVDAENFVFPFVSVDMPLQVSGESPPLLQPYETLYFCTPSNENLLRYWDTVEDRLFKIRHCMNIEGTVRELALFEPAIDVAMLVRAAAAGADLQSAIADLNAPLHSYRFNYVLQKAVELCAEVKSFGAALLSAVEKRDAEELGTLRSNHEIAVLRAVRKVKEHQIEEADFNIAGLEKTRSITEERHSYYSKIKERIPQESEHLERLTQAQTFQELANACELGVAIGAANPDTTAGTAGSFGSPLASISYGGVNIALALQSASRILSWKAGHESYKANMAATKAGWTRRWDDWKLQERLASKELEQIDKQKAAALVRMNIAEKDLEGHDLQIENATAVEEFLREKFSSQDLYSWMITQAAAAYGRAYKLAYDLAKRAERGFRFERGLTASNYIQFGYWDSLKKGLMAGEQLALDLKRMELAYLEQNRREFEISKHISLVLHDPSALIDLKVTGECTFNLPEEVFDADYPGHYFRRIKSVSITIPCVTGPYTSINCTLTLLSNKFRVDSGVGGEYTEQEDPNDPRFLYNFAAVQSIATSHAQGDTGMFELNFRDERYLPFEGAGAISRWRIQLPPENNAFDLNTVSDVVLKMSYTARDGGERLRASAQKAQAIALEGVKGDSVQPVLQRLFSIRHEFPNEWAAFPRQRKLDEEAQSPMVYKLEVDLGRERFPFQFRSAATAIEVRELEVHVSRESPDSDVEVFKSLETMVFGSENNVELTDETAQVSFSAIGKVPAVSISGVREFNDPCGPGKFVVILRPRGGDPALYGGDNAISEVPEVLLAEPANPQESRIKSGVISDILLLVRYTVKPTKVG